MTTAEFVERLRQSDVEIRTNDNKLLLSAPPGALSLELQEELRRRKSEIIALLRSEEDETKQEYCAPLTYAQQRIWLVDESAPQSSAYNMPQLLPLPGEFQYEALRNAIDRLGERHEALRTRIEVRNGEPTQVISRHPDIPLELTDLAGLNLETQQERLRALLVEESRRPFALNQPPLVRFHAIRLGPDRQLLFYNIHHIVADYWSLRVLSRDLSALYMEITSGQSADLPSLRLHYSEIAREERRTSVAKLHASQLEYWRERLQGAPALVELPFTRTRPPQQSFSGATFSRVLDSNITTRLRALAIRMNTSMYLLLLTIFATLIYRYTHQPDLCLGSPVTGRKRREEEEIVGLFLNMLPLRYIFEPTEPFDQLLRRTKDAVLTDFEHGNVPFQQLLMELHPRRSAAYSPLFQITFALNHGGADVADERRDVFITTAKYDLALEIADRENTLNAHFEYRTDLFDGSDIERFSAHFMQLIESVIRTPEDEVGALPILTEEDRESFHQWNSTELAVDREATLSSLVDKSMQEHPAALALCCGEITLTYRELKNRVDHLAASLSAQGLGPRCIAAVCLDRSPDLIIAILAVLRTGAAYLPLDPRHPPHRLASMVQDSEARVLIAHRTDLSSTLSNHNPGLEIVFIENERLPAAGNHEKTSSAALYPPHPGDAAYLIYTSGSTGKPKGVVVEHRNAVALLAWAKDYFDPDALRGVLASTSVSFDLSVFEIFLPLITGNTVILVNDILELRESPHAENVTLINTVPGAMRAVLHAGLPSTVRTVCMGGEFLPASVVDTIYSAGVAEVFDLYGPTETTVYSCCALRAPQSTPSIGTPISNTRIHLLDQNLRLVPPGVIGEIFIGGAGVARGYLNRTELNAERFLLLPDIEPDGRLYRTGDWARQMEDGSLVYLGRRDQQIKLRGHRIELGDIEANLREVTDSPAVAVVLQKLSAGDALVAFVERGAGLLDVKNCTAALRARLPAYMIPSRIIVLPALPLTVNGKVDRQKLLHLTLAEVAEPEPPHDLLEQWLANIWAIKFGKKEVARNDNFFDDLGGHSLVAFEIFLEVERRIGVALGLAVLFQAPTVELLADMIRLRGWTRPRYISLSAPGSSDSVFYSLSRSPAEWSKECGSHPQRSMLIDLPNKPDPVEVEDCARDIDRFEAARPPLVLVAANAIDTHELLAAKLSELGYGDVTIRPLGAAHEKLFDN